MLSHVDRQVGLTLVRSRAAFPRAMVLDDLLVHAEVVVSSRTDSLEHRSATGVRTVEQIAAFGVHQLMLLEVRL
jgi:hypothetical protein